MSREDREHRRHNCPVYRIGRIVAGNPRIREIYLNPVIIHPEGEGVVALDALMLVE